MEARYFSAVTCFVKSYKWDLPTLEDSNKTNCLLKVYDILCTYDENFYKVAVCAVRKWASDNEQEQNWRNKIEVPLDPIIQFPVWIFSQTSTATMRSGCFCSPPYIEEHPETSNPICVCYRAQTGPSAIRQLMYTSVMCAWFPSNLPMFPSVVCSHTDNFN
jgi:hypothetical protein